MDSIELRILAAEVAAVPVEDIPEFIDKLYDELAAVYNETQMGYIYALLKSQGVDTDGLCKKKHPPAP